ncbi:hypothetical protein Hdeb2414_s0014g00426391 [Helianthus debilis subsp. tardiflorus]
MPIRRVSKLNRIITYRSDEIRFGYALDGSCRATTKLITHESPAASSSKFSNHHHRIAPPCTTPQTVLPPCTTPDGYGLTELKKLFGSYSEHR